MKISEAIEQLVRLMEINGDIQVKTDCEHCGKSTAPNTVIAKHEVTISRNVL